jgi:hypothetical protein
VHEIALRFDVLVVDEVVARLGEMQAALGMEEQQDKTQDVDALRIAVDL